VLQTSISAVSCRALRGIVQKHVTPVSISLPPPALLECVYLVFWTLINLGFDTKKKNMIDFIFTHLLLALTAFTNVVKNTKLFTSSVMMCSLKLLFNDYLFFVNVLIFAFFFFLRLKVDGREIQIKYSSIIWTLMYNNVANKVYCLCLNMYCFSPICIVHGWEP